MSYPESVNRSTESGLSSLHRSGLNISVGDTKSIVLALQSLQQKIRVLERDRDYHQDQYERAVQANEAYKLEMEKQMDQERSMYRLRENELRQQLQRLQEEKRLLELQSSEEDLTAFRQELEGMIAAEKKHAQEREATLVTEVKRLREEVSTERERYAALVQQIDGLHEEKEKTSLTNEHLREALDELLRRHEDGPSRGYRGAAPPAPAAVHGRSGRGRGPAVGSGRRAVSRKRTPSALLQPPLAANPFESCRRHYRDPTVNSILRDVRNVSSEIPCACDVSSAIGGPTPPLRPTSSSPVSRNTSTLHTRPAEVQPASGRIAESVKNKQAIVEVEDQLQEELEDLQTQYRNTITRAANEQIPEEVVTAALTRITSLIEGKKKQLHLLKGAVHEQERQERSANAPQQAFIDKSTKRNLLVNEIREMLLNSGEK
ncbi:hypothetical protein STCU_06335 [Strigomonas culicis]|uniref:Uncharacterized protein n=1 Tax=Strigomonas culicis TaxID=28005 RepID=S9U5M1_9TRYP|nr:hypothetical protein STCU_06335 [Strigomonas culicis]|eukprot:EPY26072.1 hypothetical protein STCU_06335 [Strigomonas culicis]